jgi:hypothetical protein
MLLLIAVQFVFSFNFGSNNSAFASSGSGIEIIFNNTAPNEPNKFLFGDFRFQSEKREENTVEAWFTDTLFDSTLIYKAIYNVAESKYEIIGEPHSFPELEYLQIGTYIVSVTHLGQTEERVFEIIPRPLVINLLDGASIVYNGNTHTRRGVIDVSDGDVSRRFGGLQTQYYCNETDELLAGELPLNVGEYRLEFSFSTFTYSDIDEEGLVAGDSNNVAGINSNNFNIVRISFGDNLPLNEVLLTVTKRTLLVRAGNLTINFGEPAVFNEDAWTYESFVNYDTDTLSALKTELNARFETIPTNVGVHTLVPTVGTLQNYHIIIANTQLVINAVTLQVSSGMNRLTLNGSFQPDTSLRFLRIDRNGNAGKTASNILISGGHARFQSDLVYIFDMTFINGGRTSSTETFSITLTNVRVSSIFRHRVGIIDANGNFLEITNFSIRNNILTFNAPAGGHIVIFRDSLVTYLIIGITSGVTVLLIAAGIVSSIIYKKSKIKNKPTQKTYDF